MLHAVPEITKVILKQSLRLPIAQIVDYELIICLNNDRFFRAVCVHVVGLMLWSNQWTSAAVARCSTPWRTERLP
jgi:hypothetical protein